MYLSRIEDIAHNMAVQFITNKLFIFREHNGFSFWRVSIWSSTAKYIALARLYFQKSKDKQRM